MTAAADYLSRLRKEAHDSIARNALTLGADPAIGSTMGDGAFEVALSPPLKALVKGGMAASGADTRFDATMGQLTGGAFSPRELHVLEDRALNAARPQDLGPLQGIGEGVPVVLTPGQKGIVDRIVGQLGDDALGVKARKAYEGAVRGGRVQTR